MKKLTLIMIMIIFIITLSVNYLTINTIKFDNTFFYYKSHTQTEYYVIQQSTKVNDSTEIIKAIHSQKHEILLSLINEVDSFIKTQTKTAHKDLPEIIVNKCLYEGLDICFVMSQTQLETNYGTVGAGRENSKRSLFGVGIYEGTTMKAYPNYEVAVQSYIDLLKKSYLVKGRDVHFLMNNYINSSGYRYAGDLTYESKLKQTYNTIKRNTKIHTLQLEYGNA